MLRTECSFCDHANPAGSKYCNGCGGPLHLSTCPNCDALNDGTASVCHKCEAALPLSEATSRGFASSVAYASVESHAAGDDPTVIPQSAPDRNFEGSHKAQTDPLNFGAVSPASTPQRVFEFAGSLQHSTLSDPTRPRNRILIAVLSFIGIVCVALSAYLYWATNMAERSSAAQNATQLGVTAGAPDQSAAQAGDVARGAGQGPTNAVAPVTERVSDDVDSRVSSNAAGPGKASSTTTQACTEVVDALGLCPPQAAQRR